jgi:hypothetical protein
MFTPSKNPVVQVDGIFYPTETQITNGYQYHPDYYQWNAQRPLPGQYTTVSPLEYKREQNAIDWGELINPNNVNSNYDFIYKGEHPINGNYRYYGWVGDDRYNELFCDRSVKFMSQMITNSLQGIKNKPIVVPDATIRSVADSVFQTSFANANQMQKMVVNFIVDAIRDEYETIEKNNKLSAWVQKYDTDTGMKKFDSIKLNNKQRSHYTVWKY